MLQSCNIQVKKLALNIYRSFIKSGNALQVKRPTRTGLRIEDKKARGGKQGRLLLI